MTTKLTTPAEEEREARRRLRVGERLARDAARARAAQARSERREKQRRLTELERQLSSAARAYSRALDAANRNVDRPFPDKADRELDRAFANVMALTAQAAKLRAEVQS